MTTMPEGAFLPARSPAAALAHWMAAALTVGMLSFGAAAMIAGSAPRDALNTEEFGAETVIAFAPAIATMDSRMSQVESEASQPEQSARPELKEARSQPQTQDMPAEPEPEDPEQRMAPRETVRQTADPREITEAVTAREQVTASEASTAAMAAPDQRSDEPSETATAPDHGNTREAARRIDAWQRAIFAHIGRFRTYPEEARKRNIRGETTIYFMVDQSGGVSSVRVEKSSGHTVLDNAAMSVLRRAMPLPAPPPEAGRGQIELLVPLRYQLK